MIAGLQGRRQVSEELRLFTRGEIAQVTPQKQHQPDLRVGQRGQPIEVVSGQRVDVEVWVIGREASGRGL